MAKAIDWDAIEPHWRAGIRTKKELSEEFGVSRAAMDKHFAKLGIDRDLTAKIQARAETLVAQQAVTQEVTRNRLASTEQDIVEANARENAAAQLLHKTRVSDQLDLHGRLVGELMAVTVGREEFEKLGEIMASDDPEAPDKLADLYRKAISLPTRIAESKQLAEGGKSLIELDRKIRRIKDEDSAGDVLKKFGEGLAMSAMDAYTKMCSGGV